MEINDSHEIMLSLNEIRKVNPNLSTTVAKQLLDNSMLSSGLMADFKNMTNRVNSLLVDIMNVEKAKKPSQGKIEHKQEEVEEKEVEPEVMVEENVEQNEAKQH